MNPVTPPTQAEWLLLFVRGVMGITTAQLPDNSLTIPFAYTLACHIVNKAICGLDPFLYKVALYNLAGSNLLNYAQDPMPVVPYPPDTDSKIGLFSYMRQQFNMLGFVSGVIQSAADETTSESMVVMEAAKDFTLANIQQLKDPYGRAYLAIAQDFGPAAWGLS